MTEKTLSRVVAVSNYFKKRPSEVLGIFDEYTAFCFDEACLYFAVMSREERTSEQKTSEQKGEGFVEFLKGFSL